MNAIQPTSPIEKSLAEKENWPVAKIIKCYWYGGGTDCDLCGKKIAGRHMIDGKVSSEGFQFAMMCPDCHQKNGSGFGMGRGQLFAKLESGKWIMTFGFTIEQLKNPKGDD